MHLDPRFVRWLSRLSHTLTLTWIGIFALVSFSAAETLEVRADIGAPFLFETVEAKVTESLDGVRSQGRIALGTPLGSIDLARSDLTFEYGPRGKPGGFQTMRGTSEVPFPALGLFKGFRINSPSKAEVHFQPGSALDHLGVPLQDDRKYLAFRTTQGFSGQVAGIELEVPKGKQVTFVLDPADPYFYLTGDIPGLKKLGKLEDLGIGISARGLIPFQAKTRWQLDSRTPTFNGHLYLRGRVPFGQHPLVLEGETVVRLERVGLGPVVPTAAGGNGTLFMVVPLLDFIDFEMELGSASAAVIYAGRSSAAYFSGVGKPRLPFLPEDLPVMPERELKVAGMIDGSDLSRSFLRGEGRYEMGLSRLAKIAGVELKNLRETKGSFSLDKKGFVASGTSSTQFSRLIKLKGAVTMASHISRKHPTKDFSVSLKGNFGVGGIGLGADAEVELGPKKVGVRGALVTPIQTIELEGRLSKDGILLSGLAELKLPLKGVGKVVQTVTNGAVCGYEVVKDGAKCGWDSVTSHAVCGSKVVADGAKCGFKTVIDGSVCGFQNVTNATKCGTKVVTSAAACGTKKVTDAAVCGTVKVTDAAICGTKKITSGAICGWDTFKCLLNPFKWGKCKKPKSCRRPKTCKKPRSCNKPRKCTVAKTCKQPKSCKKPKKCKIANTCKVAKSCKDLGKPRTCKQVITDENANLGTVSLAIKVKVTQRGGGGTVLGRYCPNSGKCVDLAGGDVLFDPKPKACVVIPGLGKRCFGF